WVSTSPCCGNDLGWRLPWNPNRLCWTASAKPSNPCRMTCRSACTWPRCCSRAASTTRRSGTWVPSCSAIPATRTRWLCSVSRRRVYGKALRGGLLRYGPPGCGKTFIARAVAGELGAKFIAVSFADIIDMFVGQSERNIHELFEIARRNSPCVLFLDEVDAIGQKRSQLRNTPMRSAVNQLLLELDDISGNNDGVFLLAATNHPWDVDSALRRPGRFDRTLLVLPPDAAAREGVFRYHLKDRPVAGIDLARLAGQTDGYSGADIAHICETAAERALMDSVRIGEPRMIGPGDLEAAIGEVKPSLGAWFDTARNVALFANENGSYD